MKHRRSLSELQARRAMCKKLLFSCCKMSFLKQNKNRYTIPVSALAMFVQDLDMSRKLFGMIAQQTGKWLLQMNAAHVRSRKSRAPEPSLIASWDVSWSSMGGSVDEFKFAGVLQLGQSEVVLSSKMLGFLKKDAINVRAIQTCEVQGNAGAIIGRGPLQKKRTFKCLAGFSETEQAVAQIQAAVGAVESADQEDEIVEEQATVHEIDPMALTSADWEALTQGAKKVVYKRDEAVMREGESSQRMYQIVRGVIRVEKRLESDESMRLGELRASETFGELSFLAGSAATATCLVESEEAELVIMEGYYLNMLFRIRPEIAGRFYKFLSLLVTARVFNSPYASS